MYIYFNFMVSSSLQLLHFLQIQNIQKNISLRQEQKSPNSIILSFLSFLRPFMMSIYVNHNYISKVIRNIDLFHIEINMFEILLFIFKKDMNMFDDIQYVDIFINFTNKILYKTQFTFKLNFIVTKN
ncbi:hypothetical protein pb186bvf_018067 [Paramecium bursaria]